VDRVIIPPEMIRSALAIIGLLVLAAATAILLNVPAALSFWPYSTYYGSEFSRLFLGSMVAAVGAPMVWIGLSGELAALRPGAINIGTVAFCLGVHALLRSGGASGRVLLFAAGNGVVMLAAALLFLWARRLPWRDARPMPAPVRAAFAAFALVLLLVGAGLILRQPLFPWRLDSDNAVAYGAMFLGAMAYFVYGLLRPVWGNAKGQLIGFLAYDLVLLPPFLLLWPTTSGQSRLSLAVYLVVILSSAALAVWYLLSSTRWRLGSGLAAGAIAPAPQAS
jgi:hypothetical protein